MKKLLTLLFLAFSAMVFCQTPFDSAMKKMQDSGGATMGTTTKVATVSLKVDTLPFRLIEGITGAGYSDTAVSVIEWENGRIEIIGDTIAAIKLLLKSLKEANERAFGLWNFVGRAVDWTNTVPDYLRSSKNNKSWAKYYKELKKLGFKQTSK